MNLYSLLTVAMVDMNKITNKKRRLYTKYSEAETSLTLLPFSEKGSLDTQIFMRENFGSYSPSTNSKYG